MGDFFVPCCFGMSRAFLFHPGTLSLLWTPLHQVFLERRVVHALLSS